MDPGKLLESGKYSDLTIICRGREFRVHKAILCPQSEIISKLCDIDMQEKHTGKIQHEEFDDDTMERMIEFAYRKQYKATVRPKALGPEGMKALVRDTASSTVEDDLFVGGIALVQNDADSVNASIQEEEIQQSATDVWVIHARVYGLADYYDMSELRDYAMDCFMQVSKDEQEDIAVDGFIHVAREVSKRTTSDSGFSSNSPLRAGFLSLFSTHAPKLAADGDFLAALYEPGSKDITVEMFKILGQKMVELETENKETAASFQAEKEVLQQLFSGATQNVEARVRGAQHREEVAVERREDTEESTQRLLRSLRNLPAACLNNNCNNEFGELKFEMKGNGDWQVRCGAKKCKCKLN